MIPFTFDEATHVYKVEGQYCLSTSDIIHLAGLSEYGSVPSKVLENARNRGTSLHKAIHYFEEGDLDFDSLPENVQPYLRAYMKFRVEREFEPIPPQEHAIVYEHENTGQLIGCTLDLRGTVGGKLYIVDPKTTYPNSGAAKKQTHLKWRMQLQSYWEATMVDEPFWEAASDGPIARAILHLKKDATYDFLDFSMDDALNWDACIRMARLRLANGWKRDEKTLRTAPETGQASYVEPLREMVAMNDAEYIDSLMEVVGEEVAP